jgi:hypothetical protein
MHCQIFLAPHGTEGDNMRKLQNCALDRVTTLLVAVGGDPVAGSGFEAEVSEPSFTSNELSEDEVRRTGTE